MTERRAESNRRGLLSLMSRKRKRKEQGVEIPREPVRLNFLFVGSKSSGQTSLLLYVHPVSNGGVLMCMLIICSRSRYGYFPHASLISPHLVCKLT